MTFTNQIQHRLAGLEKDLDLPAFAIDADDFFFGERCICAYESKPILTIGLVSYANDFCWNGILFPYHHINRKKIPGTATTFLVPGIYFLDIKLALTISVLDAAAFLDHGNDIHSSRLKRSYLCRIGKPGIKKHNNLPT